MALTIVFALAASLLLSLTVIPVLASFLLKEGAHREPWLMRMLERGYTPLLDWALTHPKTLGIAAAVSLLLGGAAYVNTGKTFMPTMDEGDLLMQLMKPPAISLERSAAIDLAVEQRIRARIPEVEHVIARLGSDELGLDPMGLNETD
ncbi:Acriflavin resistance protein, partial [mine drainage metagenome]